MLFCIGKVFFYPYSLSIVYSRGSHPHCVHFLYIVYIFLRVRIALVLFESIHAHKITDSQFFIILSYEKVIVLIKTYEKILNQNQKNIFIYQDLIE